MKYVKQGQIVTVHHVRQNFEFYIKPLESSKDHNIFAMVTAKTKRFPMRDIETLKLL